MVLHLRRVIIEILATDLDTLDLRPMTTMYFDRFGGSMLEIGSFVSLNFMANT